MKITYSVYIIENKELDMNHVTVFVAPNDGFSSGLNSEGDAVSWIENCGVKNCKYAIIKEFRKI
jgi:hypothetical protein